MLVKLTPWLFLYLSLVWFAAAFLCYRIIGCTLSFNLLVNSGQVLKLAAHQGLFTVHKGSAAPRLRTTALWPWRHLWTTPPSQNCYLFDSNRDLSSSLPLVFSIRQTYLARRFCYLSHPFRKKIGLVVKTCFYLLLRQEQARFSEMATDNKK